MVAVMSGADGELIALVTRWRGRVRVWWRGAVGAGLVAVAVAA